MGKLVATTIPLGTNPAALVLLIAIPIAIFVIILVFTLPTIFCRIVVSDDRIAIATPLSKGFSFGRDDVASISIVNLTEAKDLAPTIRLWGTSAFGFKLGWFKLANGCKAYLAICGKSDLAIAIRLKDGTYVIISPKDLDRFVKALRNYGWLK